MNPTTRKHNDRGIALSRLGEKEAAITAFSEALASAPECVEVQFNRGMAYYETGRLQCAVLDFSAAITLDPDRFLAYYCRALALIRLGERLALAERDLGWFIQNNPRVGDGYRQRYLLKLSQGRFVEALEDAKAVTHVAPGSPIGYMDQYEAYKRMRKLDKAMMMLDQALAIAPFGIAYHNRGVLRFLLKHPEDDIIHDLKEASLLYHHEGHYAQRDEMTRMLTHYLEHHEL